MCYSPYNAKSRTKTLKNKEFFNVANSDNVIDRGWGAKLRLSANAADARVVAHNNVFYGSDKIIGTVGGGISGSNNWVQISATMPATFFAAVQASEPGFVNRAARDLHFQSHG